MSDLLGNNIVGFPTRRLIFNFQQVKDAVTLCEFFAWLEKQVFEI